MGGTDSVVEATSLSGVAEMQEALPSTTAQDWVTYADHVVTVTATSEHRGDPDAGVEESGEGVVPRFVTLRVDEVLWSRDGAPERPPSELEIIWGGWSVSEGEDERPFITADTVEISVGSSYVLPLVYLALFDESPSWTPLSVTARPPCRRWHDRPRQSLEHVHRPRRLLRATRGRPRRRAASRGLG